MRIDNYGPQATPEDNRTGAANSAGTSGTNAAPRNLGQDLGEDQAQLSGAHTQVLALSAQVAQLPEIRQERVQALRQAVESGQYRVSPEQVAGAVFAHMETAQAA